MITYKKRELKTMNCKVCDSEVKNCGIDVVKVTCWRCVNASLEEFNKNNKTDRDVQSDLRDS